MGTLLFQYREDPLRSRLKHFVVDALNLSDIKADWITDDEPLLGGRIRLDSLDALELYMGLEEEFGIEIVTGADSRAALASISCLAEYIRRQMAAAKSRGIADGPAQLSA